MEEKPPLDRLHVRGGRQELGHRRVERVHHWEQECHKSERQITIQPRREVTATGTLVLKCSFLK